MTTYTSHVTDGIDLLVSPVTFASGAGATTLTGGAVSAYAKNRQNGATYAANTCTIASGTSVRATWTGGTLPAGRYNVQVYATPLGYAIQTIADLDFIVKEAASA